jgi:predicted RNA binding protein YcfA (HicA-like mRNA interferase family)
LRRLSRLASNRGWQYDATEGGRHTKVRLNGRATTVPRHPGDLKSGTFRSILKQLGLTETELEN